MAVNPSPMFGFNQFNGALPPTEIARPSAKKVPPEQKAFVKYAKGTAEFDCGSYSEDMA